MRLMQQVTEYINFRNTHPIPDVMTIMSGIGSPQEMLHTDEKWHTEGFSWGNARKRRKNFWTEDIEKSWSGSQTDAIKRMISCYNCPQSCGALIDVENLPRYMMKCFSKLTYSMAAYVDNLDFGFKIVQRAQEYGVDGFSTPQILAFGVELKENGILTDKDFEGCPPDDDKEGRFFWLLDRLANREGIGDVLADGTYWAAKRIGKGAEALLPDVFHQREDQHHPDRGELAPGAVSRARAARTVCKGLAPASRRKVQGVFPRLGAEGGQVDPPLPDATDVQ
jgi:aldehyde:ferredoxin oxidoreductase